MSKRSRHGHKQQRDYHSDFTVHHFADSKPGQFSGTRGKKGDTSKILVKSGTDSGSMAVEEDDVSWFEKDLDDFDVTIGENTEETEEEEQPIPVSKKLSGKKSARQIEDVGGIVYPIDLWFVLSRWIYPESVATFAGLCKGTNAVVCTVQFWKQMYIRYYNDKVTLPDDLQLTSIECIHGLRARTIRMLHFVYPPLVSRTQTTVPFENEPHCLVGQRCILTWHRKWTNSWKFYLRFRKGDEVNLESNQRQSIESPKFENWHQDLFYNPDNHSSVLEVTCPSFTPIPMVMGLILNRVYFNVSSGSMRFQRLKLVMDSNFRTTTAKNQNGMQELVLDPILELKVYPWFHPGFANAQSVLLDSEL